MKIGIYGGSFNPPHIMHKSIVEELIKKEYVDKTKQMEYESKIEELLNTETEKTITFTREELSGFNMSVDDLICLYNCIKDGEKIENN